MVNKTYLFFTFWVCIFCFLNGLNAQDTLKLYLSTNGNYIKYTVGKEETLFTIGKVFQIPPVKLAEANQTDVTQPINEKKSIQVPVGSFNYYRMAMENTRPLAYTIDENESLESISKKLNVTSRLLEVWNPQLKKESIVGQKIHVGWIAFKQPVKTSGIKTPVKESGKNIAFNQKPADKKIAVKQEAENTTKNKENVTIYTPSLLDSTHQIIDSLQSVNDSLKSLGYWKEFEEENGGFSLFTQTGACVLYNLKMATGSGHYYAMHNEAVIGSYIKVESPANNKVIYAKVIGRIPKINKYHNAVLALSDNAARALNIKSPKFFGRISYR